MPRQEAEHQTSHQGACDVFRHRTIYVDALAACRCVATHTISSESRSSDRTATELSVSSAAVDADITKHMRAEFVTQRLLKFVTQ